MPQVHSARIKNLGLTVRTDGMEIGYGEGLRLGTVLTSVLYGPDQPAQTGGFFLLSDGANTTPVPLTELRMPRENTFTFSAQNPQLEISGAIAPADTPEMLQLDLAFSPKVDLPMSRLHLPFAVHLDVIGAWMPNLLYKKGRLIADHVFRSPAAMLWSKDLGLALIPDPTFLQNDSPVKTALDFRTRHAVFQGPYLSYGFAGYKPSGHTFYKETPVTANAGATYKTRCFILLGRMGKRELMRRVNRFLYTKFMAPALRENYPQALPFASYCKKGMRYLFESGLWIDVKNDTADCGGVSAFDVASDTEPRTVGAVQTALWRKLPYLVSLIQTRLLPKRFNDEQFLVKSEKAMRKRKARRLPLVSFTAWFNNLRTAYGAKAFGQRHELPDLEQKADRILNLVLSAPTQAGAIPALCYCPSGKPIWDKGSKGFTWSTGAYHTMDMATTLYWLIRWQKDFGGTQALSEKIQAGCQLFEALQQKPGNIPAWFTIRSGRPKPKPTLAASATTGSAVWVLAEHGAHTGQQPFLSAAKRGAEFLIEKVIEPGRYQDFETFFSCSRRPLDSVDPLTGIAPETNLGTFWTAGALLALHEATGQRRYLDYGRAALDRLSLYQQVHCAAHLRINALGGFGVMNTDGEWNDSRQALFAPLYFRYFAATGEPEYFDRGRAALAASFVCMLVPENRSLAAGNPTDYPARCTGAVYENYGHFGTDFRVPGYIEADWGTGSACTAAAEILATYGGLFIDLEKNAAFGIDGCEVLDMNRTTETLELSVKDILGQKRALELMVRNPGRESLPLSINGRPTAMLTGDPHQTLLLSLPFED